MIKSHSNFRVITANVLDVQICRNFMVRVRKINAEWQTVQTLIRLLLQEQSDQGSALFTQARLCQYWRSLWKIIWYECDTNDCVGLRSDTVSQNSNRKQFHLDNIICMEYHCICDFYLLHGFVWEIPYQTFTGIFYPPPPPIKFEEVWGGILVWACLCLSVHYTLHMVNNG